MNKKLVVSASLLAKSQVAAYTRKDGTMVQSHDNGRQAAAPEPINHKALAKLKTSHHTDARALKSSLASSLSSGDTEGHDGKPLTYGDVKGHLNSMRMQLGSKPEHAEHLKHAQYALNQSFGLNHAPISEKHAKLIGAALSGKTRMSDDGVVQHAGGAAAKNPMPPHVQKMVTDVAQSSAKPEHKKAAIDAIVAKHAGDDAASKPAAGRPAPAPGDVGHEEHQKYGVHFKKGDKVKDRYGKSHEVLSHNGPEVKTASGESFHPTKLFHADTKPAPKLAVRAAVAKKAAAKTGSAAPEKKVNIGSEKWPLHARSSEKLPTKHADGSTHHVGGFEAPSGGAGDHFLHHEGKTYSFTGKRGKNMKTGERSFEFAHHDHEKGLEHRAWVTRTGHLMND